MLKGKTAFVTGGSGAIGQAIVRTMAREGCCVVFSYKNNAGKARQLEEEIGASVRSFKLDVLDKKAAIDLAARVENEVGPVDVLVNNAGVVQVLPFAMIEEEDWDMIMDVNIKGMFLVTKAFARGMIRRKKGNIINLSSLAGTRMLEVPVHYATAKSAVHGFTLALARELGRYKIRVNAVVPGMITEGVSVNIPAEQRRHYEEHCALQRAGTPQEVAELITFLASDRSGYINAQAIVADGGI